MKRLAMAAALFVSLLAPLVSAQPVFVSPQPQSKPAGGPLAIGIARNQQELQELAGFVAQNKAEIKSIAGDIVVSLAGAIAGTGPESEFGQGPRQLITAYQKIKDALETDKSIVDGDGWMTVSNLLKQALDIVGETELPVKLANTLTDLAVKTSQMVSLAQQNADLVAVEVKVARAQQYLLAKAKAASQSGTAGLDNSALQAVEDYLANFPIRLEPLPENPDGTDANGAELDKALNENITREMGADNPHLPDFLIPTQSQSDDWTRLQTAFQGLAQIGNAFNPPHRSPITPELLAAMDAWVKRLAQEQKQMLSALSAMGNCIQSNPKNFESVCAASIAQFRGSRATFETDSPGVSFSNTTPQTSPTAATPPTQGQPKQTTQIGNGSSGVTSSPGVNAQNPIVASESTKLPGGPVSPAIGPQSLQPKALPVISAANAAASRSGVTRPSGGVNFSRPQGYVTNSDLNSQVDRLIELIQETEQTKSKVRNSLLKLDPTLPSRIATSRSPNLSLPQANGATANNPASAAGSRGTAVGSSSSLRATPSQATRPAVASAPLTGAPSVASPSGAMPKGGIDFSGPQAYKTNAELDGDVDKLIKQAEAESKQKKK